MNKRQEKILHILGEENKWFTANELAKLLSVSNRTIRSDIDTINKVYSEKLITSNLRSGYAIIPETISIETTELIAELTRKKFIYSKVTSLIT